MFNARAERRLLEAARRDGCEERYFEELEEAILGDERAYTANDFSVRGLFEAFVDDGREIVDSWAPTAARSQPGGGVRMCEAGVDTSAFANITGQIVFSTVLDTWNNPAFLAGQLARTVPTNLNGEKVPGISGLGDEADEVAEGYPYPQAGLTEEWVETPETSKRGFWVGVTKEAVFFDRTGILIQQASSVTEWLAINKEKRVLDAALGLVDLYRRNGAAAIATYGDSAGNHDWDNLAASNGLADWTDVENALLLFDDITDPNTGEPVLLNPNTIIVPTALSFTAQRIVGATEIREVTNSNTTTISNNPLGQARNGLAGGGGGWTILSNQYVKNRTSSSTTWFIGDPQAAFWYMENWPIQSITAPPSSEAEFTHDIVQRYKVTERGTTAVMEPRKMVKCTA